jgi:hypothetical protein
MAFLVCLDYTVLDGGKLRLDAAHAFALGPRRLGLEVDVEG